MTTCVSQQHRERGSWFGRAALAAVICVFGALTSSLAAQEDQPQSPEMPAFPDLTIPSQANLAQLEDILKRAKRAQPRNPNQYQAMQTAIRDVSVKIMAKLKDQKQSARYKQAELDNITGSVALMTYFGEDAKQKTLEQVHKFLKRRKQLSLSDVQTGMMAAAMLELQPNKKPARDTYQLLCDLLEEDEREEMQSLRLNLKASVRRLDLLGNRFELQATALDGKKIQVDDFAGKYLIVDFFATWCEPCRAEVPRLKRHYEKYHSKGLEVVGISLDEDRQALDKFLASETLPWPVIHDDSSDPLKSLRMEFGVSQLPTVLLLNKEGTVVSLEARGSELDRLVQMLFEAPTPAPAPKDLSGESAAQPNSEAQSAPEVQSTSESGSVQ